MTRPRLLIAGSLVLAVSLGFTSLALAKPLSKDQWLKKGNAICKQVNKDINAIANDAFAGLKKNQKPSAEQAAAFADRAGPKIEQAILKIDALEEPKSLRNDVKKFLAAASEVLAKLQSDPLVIVNDRDPFAKANKIARKVGLTVCANGT
jgi:Txe/YoeB family toxin of Txe-Axe toxin-antitoxin module